jgi:hypothetical protein
MQGKIATESNDKLDTPVNLTVPKPGALRDGAPFRDWVLPTFLERVRHRLKGVSDGDRQMLSILGCVAMVRLS